MQWRRDRDLTSSLNSCQLSPAISIDLYCLSRLSSLSKSVFYHNAKQIVRCTCCGIVWTNVDIIRRLPPRLALAPSSRTTSSMISDSDSRATTCKNKINGKTIIFAISNHQPTATDCQVYWRYTSKDSITRHYTTVWQQNRRCISGVRLLMRSSNDLQYNCEQ